MMFVRGLLCFAVLTVALQQEVSVEGNSEDYGESDVSVDYGEDNGENYGYGDFSEFYGEDNGEDYGDSDFVQYLKLFGQVSGVEDSLAGLKKDDWNMDWFDKLSDREVFKLLEIVNKVIRFFSSILPREVGREGTEIHKMFHKLRSGVDHVELTFGMLETLSQPKNFGRYVKLFYKKHYLSTFDSAIASMQQPVSGRSKFTTLFFDYIARAWAIPIRNLVVSSIDGIVDVVSDHSEKSSNAPERNRRHLEDEYADAFVEEVYRIKHDIFKMMEDHPGPVRSVYAHNHRLIQTELINNRASFARRELFRLQYSLWSFVRFGLVYKAIKKECYTGNDKQNYTLIEGGSYVDDQYLHRIMENADFERAKACKFYKHSMGVTEADEIQFVSERFLNLHLSMYDPMVTVPSDVLMIDAVSQYMLGDIESACLLRFLCHAGLHRTAFKREGSLLPGVDFILGFIVSGRTGFEEYFDQSHIIKIGTPKMAETIVEGYRGDCAAYDELGYCFDIDTFNRDVAALKEGTVTMHRVWQLFQDLWNN